MNRKKTKCQGTCLILVKTSCGQRHIATNELHLFLRLPVTSYQLLVSSYQLRVTVTVTVTGTVTVTAVFITIIIIPTNNFLGGKKKIIKKVEKKSGKKKWG